MSPSRDEAGRLAHELNNLLAVIGGHADALEPALPADGPDRESIVAIQRAVMTAAGVTDRVRRLGRTTATAARGVDVQPVVTTVSNDATRQFGHRVTVAVHAAASLWSASVPPALIERLLWHLLSRAVDVMPHGATLNVRCMNVELGLPVLGATSRRERHVRIALSCPTVSGRVALSSPSGDLVDHDVEALSAALAEAGGRLSVETDGASMATWALLLPSDGVEPLRPVQATTVRAATILLLDADEARRSLVHAVLQRQGYTPRVAGSVDDAARSLAQAPVDLLVADAALKGLGGDVASLARRHSVRVLRIESGSASVPAPVAESIRAPFTADQLVAGVEAALDVAMPPARLLAYRRVVGLPSEEIA